MEKKVEQLVNETYETQKQVSNSGRFRWISDQKE
jgi:hypothetical protein